MASQQQSVLIFSKQRHASNGSARQRSSGNSSSGQQHQKDVKFTINSRQQIEHTAHAQARMNHAPGTKHHYQQSAQISAANSKSGAAMFNPVQMLSSSQESVKQKPATVNLGNYKDLSNQQLRRQQQSKNAGGHVDMSTTNQQLQFSQNQVVGRNHVPDSNMAISSHKVQYRSKFQGSFLASHNNKSKTASIAGGIEQQHVVSRSGPGKYSVSPHGVPSQKLKAQGMQPPQVKPQNKSPAVVANPSIFTITQTTGNNAGSSGMVSPPNQGSNGSHAQRLSAGAGSNPSSVRHNSTKQSDVLLATEQSTVKQRENIKVFSFKPGNLKVQPKQLNVQQIKANQVTLNKDQRTQMNILFQKGSATSQPSPTNIVPQVVKARNRSSGSSGTKNQSIIVSSRQKYPSPEGNVSNESNQQMIIMQPNIVKKPLNTNYSLEDSAEGRDISPNPSTNGTSVRSKKKILSQPTVLTQQSSKRVKSASRHSQVAGVGTTNPHSSQADYGTARLSTSTKLKIKKRGHSETTEANQSIVVTQSSKQNNVRDSFQQRGNSLQPKSVADSVSHKLALLKQQQVAEELRQQKQNEPDHKEIIVNHIRKYIKMKPSNEASTQLRNGVPEEKTELIIQNLRDFLVYLENKNIINPKKLGDQNEMKNLIKDIMKLDLSKFSKPRSSSQPRAPQHHAQQSDGGNSSTIQVQKKRKVLPSPNTHTDQKTVPTQMSGTHSTQQSVVNFAKQPVKKVAIHESSRTKTTSMETSPLRQNYEYSNLPKYMKIAQQKGGIKTTGHRSRDNSGNERIGGQSHYSPTETTQLNSSQVNFVLPSNRQQESKRSSMHIQDNYNSGDVYGTKSLKQSMIKSSHGSPDSQAQMDTKHPKHSSKFSEQPNVVNFDVPQRSSLKQTGIKIQGKDSSHISLKKKRVSTSKGSIGDQERDSQGFHSGEHKHTPKLRVNSTRGVKTCVPSTQQSPRNYQQTKLVTNNGAPTSLISHQKVSSQPNLGADQSSSLQQQVPTIQLMINTNGQGKFLGINVNNYCVVPGTNGQNQVMQEDQSRQIQQLLDIQSAQNNSSAEQLKRSQHAQLLQKQYQQAVKTEPDQAEPNPSRLADGYQSNQKEQSILKDFIRQQQNKNTLATEYASGQQRIQTSSGLGSQEFQIAPSPDPSVNESKKSKFSDQSRNFQQKQRGMMIIQDEDDENTGGNGAEAKMSPTSSGQANVFQQTGKGTGHHETPLVAKLQQTKQQSSSNRAGSGRSSSNRNSSLTKALQDLNKSQIQASQYKNLQIGRRDSRSKESSKERQPKVENFGQTGGNVSRQPAPSVKANTCAPTPSVNSPTHGSQSSQVVLNDDVTQDREKLIKYVKSYVAKHKKIPHTTLDFYKCVKLLGKGAFGKITLGIHKLTGKYVAIKSIDKVNIKDEYSRRKVFQEVYILKKIRHSCVIRLLEVFESEKHFLMVMEYSGGGDLLQYVKKRKRLNEQSAKAIFKQILYALGHCHCRSVLHRDIKLDNVLMDGEGGVKLCDFGVSRLVKKGQTINEQCGTPAYLAPEIIIDKGYQGFSADIWSLGVLLYAMVQGTVPFKAHNIADLHKLILKGDFVFPVETVSDEVKDLVTKMLVLDPSQRISIPQMLNHPWVFDLQGGLGEPGNMDDEEHDLRVGSTFFREEVLGGLISGYKSDGTENGNINFVNVENLYYRGGQPQKEPTTDPSEKVTYSDYCALTEDFMTYRLDEQALEIVTGFGYSRELVIESINRGDVNHATAAYYLLVY